MSDHTRRQLVKITAAAAIAAPLAGQSSAPLFFTPEEFGLVDELSELIIPADEHSPGARAAQVAAYIDKCLAESFEAEARQLWRDGLKRIEALSSRMHGRPFLEATPHQRVAL